MASRQVDGLVLPVMVAGDPALELCNTVAGWPDNHGRDYLEGYDHLAVLGREVGIVTPVLARRLRREAAAQPRRAATVLREAKALRAALYEVLVAARPNSSAGELLGRAIASAARDSALARPRGAAPRWSVRPEVGLRLPVDAFAVAALRLIDSGAATKVRRCPGDGCGWVFIDRSGRRRWCIMSVCGNRSKVRAYARRGRPVTA